MKRASVLVVAASLAALVASVCTRAPDAAAATLACVPTLCSTQSPNPCVVGGATTVNVTPGDTIDCTNRDVDIDGTIKVTDGFFKLIAKTLDVNSGGRIEAVDGSGGGTVGGFELEIAGAVNIIGSLQAIGAAGRGGEITVNAAGNITIAADGDKGVEASGYGLDDDGGRIELVSAGAVTINGQILAESGGSGEVVGGQVTIEAATDVLVSGTSAKIFVDGHKADAGEIQITAGGLVRTDAGATVTADGRGAGGNGGAVYITTQDRVEIWAPLSARGGKGTGGQDAFGGTLKVESGCGGVEILANLDLRAGEAGGNYDGGSLEVETLGDLTLGTAVLIDTYAVGARGSAGDVRLVAGGKVLMKTDAKIRAYGDQTTGGGGDGLGASVELLGCKLETQAGATIDVRGVEGGAVFLYAAEDDAAPNVTSMKIAATSSFDARGEVAASDGTIDVAVGRESLSGTCSTDGDPCTLDVDCNVGCTPGNCDGVNPDTADVLTQFKSTPDIAEDTELVACATECTP